MNTGPERRARRLPILAVVLVAVALMACGLIPRPPIIGVIDSTAEVGGAACPLLITGTDGTKWEVTLEGSYSISFGPGDAAVVSEGPIPIARTGERVRLEVFESRSEPSACRWGTPVVAIEVDRAP